MSKLTKAQMEALLGEYRYKIRSMQGKTFYCEDENGILRRWYPPRISLQDPTREGRE